MTKNDLRKMLINSNIPKDTYSLEGGLPNEAYCFNQNGDKWEVYYSERGQKSGLKLFSTEDEACDYFYKSLVQMLKGMGIL
ncbi:conserved hypothetical protein [Desulfofarcimen acetoxidans DSM 771]|jgi:hypothetical protein|uniref:Uncharacterized protein n=1 Tax=Desulfofarcimen acetoxidans (strain ATCC 49208 / DSM 771 / KCTC 5769 / VKM B-1644 / 5575) TaxID=485916 RepID=C8W6S0_DESAS|nr:hypothetical protein [Desulfofarcimen acetoxidans]ACV64179.1 conserved hypothetical protein [Desulfofarcimen acetoxidans DSM 771]